MEQFRNDNLVLTARMGRCVACACTERGGDAPLVMHWFTAGLPASEASQSLLDRLCSLTAGTTVSEWADSREILWGKPQVVTHVAYNSDECNLEKNHNIIESLCSLNMIHCPNADSPTAISTDIRIDLMRCREVPPADIPVSVQPQWCRTLLSRTFTPPSTTAHPIQYRFAYRWDAQDYMSLLRKRRGGGCDPVCEVTLSAQGINAMSPLELGYACDGLIARAKHLLHPGPHPQRYMLFEQGSETGGTDGAPPPQ